MNLATEKRAKIRRHSPGNGTIALRDLEMCLRSHGMRATFHGSNSFNREHELFYEIPRNPRFITRSPEWNDHCVINPFIVVRTYSLNICFIAINVRGCQNCRSCLSKGDKNECGALLSLFRRRSYIMWILTLPDSELLVLQRDLENGPWLRLRSPQTTVPQVGPQRLSRETPRCFL